MEIGEILKFLPHRYPFLLIDRVLEADEKRFRALKNVTFNEPHFQGHFPGYPVMPGVLILEPWPRRPWELVRQPGFAPGGWVFLVGVEEARFKKPVVPGDTSSWRGSSFSSAGDWARWRSGPWWRGRRGPGPP